MTLANNGTGFEGCRCFILRNKILEEDFPNDENYGEWFPNNAKLYFMYLIFGIQNLLKQQYVKQSDIEKLSDLGFKQDSVIRGIDSAGINLTPLSLETTNTNATYLLSIQAPLLVTTKSFMSFCRLFYNTFNGFKSVLILLLKQIPVIVITSQAEQTLFVPLDMAQVLATIDPVFEWDFTLNGIRFRYNAPESIRGATQQFKQGLSQVIKTVLPSIFETLILKKCYKNYDKKLTNGFFVINTFRGDIEWINASEDLWTPWDPATVYEKIRTILVRTMINKDIPNLAQIQALEVNYHYETRHNELTNIANPFAIFGSLQEEDIKTIGTIMGQFLFTYKEEYGVRNDISPFLGALTRFCYSTEKTPEVVASTSEITSTFNEILARKIFTLEKLTNNIYISSTKDYYGCFIIPMQLANYRIKWYLKRDFIEFFRFFDSVYFKPEYLRMLSPEGIGILKRLSTFDSKVLDALTLVVNN